MTQLTKALLLLVSCVFTQNFVFVRLIGASPALKRAGTIATAAVVGVYTTLVMALAAAVNWLAYHMVLLPLNAQSLYLIAFVLVIAGAAWLVGRILAAIRPELSEALSENRVPFAANCAVLGASLLGMNGGFARAALTGLFGGLGFMLASLLLAGVRERLEFSKVPKAMRGLPITLVSAGLIALAFMGFTGL